MIAVVAAGGAGTRMRPATAFVNKHLLPTGGGKLMIDWPLDHVRAIGFTEAVVVTGCEHAGQISEYVGDGEKYGFGRIRYEIQPKPAGIADVVRRVSPLLRNEPENGLMLILGDNYFSNAQLCAVDQMTNRAVCWQYDIGSLERAKSFGQVFFDLDPKNLNLKPKSIVEKPTNPQHSKILTGLYYFPRDVVDRLELVKPSGRGELEVTDLLQAYLSVGRLEVRDVAGTWADLGEWPSWTKFVGEARP